MCDPFPEPALINVKTLAHLLGVSVRHCWRMNDRNALPKPLRLGCGKRSGVVRWRRAEIERWLQELQTKQR